VGGPYILGCVRKRDYRLQPLALLLFRFLVMKQAVCSAMPRAHWRPKAMDPLDLGLEPPKL
jgi:hypothetical protein